jgi:hypothetical protein
VLKLNGTISQFLWESFDMSEIIDNETTTFDEAEHIVFECPLCETGEVRVADPIGLYTGRPVSLSTSKGSTRISAGVAVGRCNSCKLPIPLEPFNVDINGELTERIYRTGREKNLSSHKQNINNEEERNDERI